MNYDTLSNEEVLRDLCNKFNTLRVTKKYKYSEISENSGVGTTVISNFINNNSNITLNTFIRLLRGIDELDQLERLMQIKTQYKPSENVQTLPKRVTDDKSTNNSPKEIIWEEDKE